MTPDELLRSRIRDVPDFPKPGIVFKDITPLLHDREALRLACDRLADPFRARGVDLVVGVESRGFIFGAAVALQLGAGFVIARKKGKLPWDTMAEKYALEYGVEEIEMHRDAVDGGGRVLLVDDLIATGGTAAATVRLVRALGAEVAGASFLIELGFLDGRRALDGVELHSVITY